MNHNQTAVSTLVDEITSLTRKYKKSGLWTAAVWREAAHLVNVILQSVYPRDRWRFIQIQTGGDFGLFDLARYHMALETFSSDI